jgi:hypothetical protein
MTSPTTPGWEGINWDDDEGVSHNIKFSAGHDQDQDVVKMKRVMLNGH